MSASEIRILLVDDDQTWIMAMEKMLLKCHYNVTTCSGGCEALVTFVQNREKFDIVITDVEMPHMDGFKLLEHIRLEENGVPVILMSSDWTKLNKAGDIGATDYWLKPVRQAKLESIPKYVVRKKN